MSALQCTLEWWMGPTNWTWQWEMGVWVLSCFDFNCKFHIFNPECFPDHIFMCMHLTRVYCHIIRHLFFNLEYHSNTLYDWWMSVSMLTCRWVKLMMCNVSVVCSDSKTFYSGYWVAIKRRRHTTNSPAHSSCSCISAGEYIDYTQ